MPVASPVLTGFTTLNQINEQARKETMKTQTYGQYCGLARALEVVGQPWAFLIIRDLLVAPKGFADLRQGLPGIHASVLSARLEELERAGVIRQGTPTLSADPVVFELTEYGNELEDIAFRLSRWGSKTLGSPRRDETVTSNSMIMALRTMFRPESAEGVRLGYQLNLGDIVLSARVDDGTLKVGEGPLAGADLVMDAGPALKALMAGEMSPREALESGGVRLTGDPRLLDWFVELFHIPLAPPGRYPHEGLPAYVGAVQPPAMPAYARERTAAPAVMAETGSASPNGLVSHGRPPTISAP
jgi:DNA-binding HxlR family transcriptional regulator